MPDPGPQCVQDPAFLQRRNGPALGRDPPRGDPATPLQLLKYMVGVWQREIEGGAARDRLPPIIPLVFFHGRGKWRAARSVVEMIDAPDELAPLLRDFAYVLHDLGEIAPPRLSADPGVRAGLLALRAVQFEEVPGDLLDLIVGGPVAGSEYERHIIRHVVERVNLTPALLEAWAEAVLTAGSLDEVLRAGPGG